MDDKVEALLMTDVELDRIISLKEAAELMGVSVQTVRRVHEDKIIKLSPRRLGMKVKDALSWEAIGKQSRDNS